MGVITLKIDDELEKRFRRRASEIFGLARGSLSKAFEEAMAVWLESRPSVEEQSLKSEFSALKDGKIIGTAGSLAELAQRLRELHVDPRDTEIRSALLYREAERLGLRATHAARSNPP